jgi:protein gp37
MSKIEWTGKTLNPIIGCSPAAGSEKGACLNCYAQGQVHRFGESYRSANGLIRLGKGPRDALTFKPTDADGKTLGKGAKWTGEVWLLPEVLAVPLRRKKPTTWFVNSLSDLFHEHLVDSEEGRRFIAAIFGVMAATPQHQYQVLTKRPEKAREWFAWLDERADLAAGMFPHDSIDWRRGHCIRAAAMSYGLSVGVVAEAWPLSNVWIGTSVENQATADTRIPELLEVPAAVRWLSCEPLLGPIDLGICDMPYTGIGPDWVVAGGESGPKARTCDVAWIRDLVEQCRDAEIPVFVKQLGSRPFDLDLQPSLKDSKGGDPSEWPEDLRVREYPGVTR